MYQIKEVTRDNHKDYIGKVVEVEICGYQAGMIYPEENTLIDVNGNMWTFKSDEVEGDGIWTFEDDAEDFSLIVYDNDSYQESYKEV